MSDSIPPPELCEECGDTIPCKCDAEARRPTKRESVRAKATVPGPPRTPFPLPAPPRLPAAPPRKERKY